MTINEAMAQAVQTVQLQKSLFISNRVHTIEKGPTGGPELFCCLEADVPSQGFWYGYVGKHPDKDCFAAAIIYSQAFIDGDNASDLFARIDYWLRKRLKYEPVIADGFEKVYLEAPDYCGASDALASLITSRTPAREYKGLDMRVTELFGLLNFKDEDGVYPKCP